MKEMKDEIKINEIPVDPVFFGNSFYVCNIQLRSPFWSEAFSGSKDNKKYIGWNENCLKLRYKKIQKILLEIERVYIKKKINIKIIVLPEYSIEKCITPLLKEFSLRNELMIIAGDYDQTKRVSFAQIIYPKEKKIVAVKQLKLSSSRFDQEYLSVPFNRNQNCINRFTWQPDLAESKKNMITVYVCHDFLEYICQTMDRDNAGLYVVVMCSPKIDEFYGLSSVAIRSIRGFKSNVVALCNAGDNPPGKSRSFEVNACGQTQIIGPNENGQLKINQFSEGGLLAKINLNTAFTKPTRIECSGVIENISSFAINQEGEILTSEDVLGDLKIVINPNAILKIQGLQKIYALFCIRNYSRVLESFKNIPLQSNGIFGIYDILIKSYEENWDFFEKRLSGYLGDKYNELRDPDLPQRKIYSVTCVIKYRGEFLCSAEDGELNLLSAFMDLDSDYMHSNIDFIRAKMSGKEIASSKERELIEKWIFLRVKYDSDIFPQDKNYGYEEYLVFVDIYPRGDKTKSVANKEFRKNILPYLMSEERIRTIELCGDFQEGDHSYDGSYIVHLVGNMGDVRKIVLNTIHTGAVSFDIRCRTLVIPAAESLSNDKHLYLNETIIRDPQLRNFVSEMIPYMKYIDPKNPFIIKQIDKKIIQKLSKIYSLYKRFVKLYNDRGEMLHKVNNFIYGICCGCIEDLVMNDDIYLKIKGYCFESYMSVVVKIENQLVDQRKLIINKVKTLGSDEINKYFSLKIRGDMYLKQVIDKTEMTIIGDLRDAIRLWNEKFILNSEEYVSDLKGLNKVIFYRNAFSHYQDSSKLKRKNSYEFSVDLMSAFEDALLYEEKYCGQIFSSL